MAVVSLCHIGRFLGDIEELPDRHLAAHQRELPATGSGVPDRLSCQPAIDAAEKVIAVKKGCNYYVHQGFSEQGMIKCRENDFQAPLGTLFAAELDAIDKSWGDRLNATTELGTAPANETSEPPSTSSPAELHEAVDFLLALDATKGQREEGLVRR